MAIIMPIRKKHHNLLILWHLVGIKQIASDGSRAFLIPGLVKTGSDNKI